MSEGGAVGRHRGHAGGESYFISLNDLLVGMLFIFIILLMAFALSYQSAEHELNQQVRQLQDELGQRAKARTDLLDRLRAALAKDNIHVEIDTQNGILRLPESALFAPGSADLGAAGQHTLTLLAADLANLLPCYSEVTAGRSHCPDDSEPILEAVYVEGHTDNLPISTAQFHDNWELSSMRSIRTYRYMLGAAPTLGNIRSAGGEVTLFGLSAYADQRPISPGSNATLDGRAKNRRIDLRFLLAPPSKADLTRAGGLKLGGHL